MKTFQLLPTLSHWQKIWLSCLLLLLPILGQAQATARRRMPKRRTEWEEEMQEKQKTQPS